MLHFNLDSPVRLVWFGEFISPEQGWIHLTRTLYEYELMVVTEGTLYIADEKEEYAVRAGEYLIMSPTRYQHGTRECRCRFYWMHFQADALPPSASLPDHGKFRDGDFIVGLANKLFAAERKQARGVTSRYLATSLLLELASEYGREPQEKLYLSPKKILSEKVKDFIEWHRFSDIRVTDIARELGYHEKYLSAVFHETEGVSLKGYLTGIRLREAERLLLETTYTVAEVAYFLNFRCPHNFSRFFKQHKGITPVEFRNTEKPPEPKEPD